LIADETLPYTNAKRPWKLFEEVFCDQLGTAASTIAAI
jgi:hypothetical protein